MDVSDLEFQDAKGTPVKKGRNLFRLSEWIPKVQPALAPDFFQFPSFSPDNNTSRSHYVGHQWDGLGVRVLLGPLMLLIQPLTATFSTTAQLSVTWNFSTPNGTQFLIRGSPGILYCFPWAVVRSPNTSINSRQFSLVRITALSQTSVTFGVFSDDNSGFVSTDTCDLFGFAIGIHSNA